MEEKKPKSLRTKLIILFAILAVVIAGVIIWSFLNDDEVAYRHNLVGINVPETLPQNLSAWSGELNMYENNTFSIRVTFAVDNTTTAFFVALGTYTQEQNAFTFRYYAAYRLSERAPRYITDPPPTFNMSNNRITIVLTCGSSFTFAR